MTSDISSSSVRGAPHQRPHLFSLQDTPQVACFEYIENDYRQVLAATQRSPRVGGEEGVARPRSEDHDAALLEVPYGTPADVGLGDLLDLDGGLDPGWYAASFQGGLQSHGVDDGAEHRHVVGRGPFNSELVGYVRTTEDVAAAHDDGQLGSRLHSLEDAPCRRVEATRVDSVAAIAGEALPRKLQDNALYGAELWEHGPVGLGPGFGGLIQVCC